MENICKRLDFQADNLRKEIHLYLYHNSDNPFAMFFLNITIHIIIYFGWLTVVYLITRP